jgi:hypothetical protein
MGAEHRHRRALVLRLEDTTHGGPVVAATAALSCWIFGSPNRRRLLHDLYWGSCVAPRKSWVLVVSCPIQSKRISKSCQNLVPRILEFSKSLKLIGTTKKGLSNRQQFPKKSIFISIFLYLYLYLYLPNNKEAKRLF